MHFSRRSFHGGTAGSAFAGAVSSPSLDGAPLGRGPYPGAVRRKIGSIEVTALLDGYLEMPLELFPAADPKEAEKLVADQFQAFSPRLSPVNAFLVNLGTRLVLIDTGTANSLGPTAGKLPAALAAAGVAPSQVDAVLVSHMHPDHISGALDSKGEAFFPKAEMLVSEVEYAFWHDDAAFNQAPDAVKPFFIGARAAAAKYASRLTKLPIEADVFGAIRTVPLHGHTPGHQGFMIQSGNESLFIWTDAIHHASFQVARPDWSPVYDVDPQKAAQTRKRVLDRASTDRLLVAGMHLPFPAFGHVARAGDGYRFILAEWPYAH